MGRNRVMIPESVSPAQLPRELYIFIGLSYFTPKSELIVFLLSNLQT